MWGLNCRATLIAADPSKAVAVSCPTMARSMERKATPSVLSSTTRMRRGAEVRSTLSDDEPVILPRMIGSSADLPSSAGAFLKGNMFPARIGLHNARSLRAVQAVGLSPGHLQACQTPLCNVSTIYDVGARNRS